MSAPASSLLPPRIRRLGLFPLPSVQLFPNTLLPLHIFEPRYRALTEACLEGERLMAIATLEPGYEADYEGRPSVRPLCGVGEIIDSQRRGDGRYDIVLRGLGRVRIVAEHPPSEPFRMVEAVRVDPLPGPPVLVDASLRSLIAVCDRLASLLPEGGATLRELARKEPEAGDCADVLAAALITDPDERQAALETLEVSSRLDRVTNVAAALLGRFGSSPAN